MKHDNSRKMGSIMALSLVSVMLMLSGMAAMASAAGETPPNIFYGDVSINGEWAEPGTNVSAYIGGDLKGSCEIVQTCVYSMSVDGNESDLITFTIDGDPANEDAQWHESSMPVSRRLDLSVGALPTSTPPSATPTPSKISSSPGGSGGFGDAAGTANATAAAAVNGASPAQEGGAEPASTPTISSAKEPASPDDRSPAEPKGGWIPGFEAMFAIAGLIAVVYLIRWRRN